MGQAAQGARGIFVAPSPRTRGDEGYAAVDAMVALLIISLSVVLGLQAVQQAHRAAAMTAEQRAARALMSRLLVGGPRSFTAASGDTAGFAWRVETQQTGFDRPIAVCHRAVSLTADATGRAFKAGTLETCPDEPVG